MAKSEAGASGDAAGAQEPLRAAIEHMEEGFALYDADDRLVVCNARYLSAFMPELEGEFVSGMSFEEIVTIAAERGFFARDGRTVEKVVKERMDLRHNPKQPCEMRLANGDWISYREHRTSDGGTVVLRLNITERKRTEESLRQSEERAARDGQHKYGDKPVELKGLRKNGEVFPLELSLSHWASGEQFFFTGIIRDITEKKEAERALQEAKDVAEELLHRVLPEPIVERVHAGEETIADRFEAVTVLFSDLVGFTKVSAGLTPNQLVNNLNDLFSGFDALAADLGVEKVKTIGDAYMAMAGAPTPRPDHVAAVADMALGMLAALQQFNESHDPPFKIRIGIQTGPVAAGIIGKQRFLYDIWGDTVNTASRMESYSEPDRVHVSAEVARALAGDFDLESRGIMDIRGKGKVETFFLNGRK